MGNKNFTCQSCGKENSWKKSTTNKFCDIKCFGDHKWKSSTLPKIERGEATHNSATVLKKYLVEKKGEQCEVCEQPPIWNGKKLVLQLDHIDGNSDNNFPNNLRLICPNCHTQTSTFGAKGQGNRYRKDSLRNKYLQEYKNPSKEGLPLTT